MKQAEVLKALCHKNVWNTYASLLDADAFDPPYARVFTAIGEFHKKYPDKPQASAKNLRPFTESKALASLYRAVIPDDPDVVLDAVRQYILNTNIVDLFKDFAEKFETGKVDLDVLQADLTEMQRTFARQADGVDVTRVKVDDVWSDDVLTRVCPLPVPELSNRMEGGPAAGELLTVLAPTDGGKSMFLINMARHAAECGKVVLYVTLETQLPQLMMRFYCSMSNHTKTWVLNHRDYIDDEYNPWLAECGGEIRVIDASDKEMTVADILRAADRFRESKGRLDALIIDYGDLVRSSRRYRAMREEQNLVWEELRRCAKLLNVPIITASQANRSGTASGKVGIIHVAEAWGKATGSDLVVIIDRDERDISRNVAHLRIVKTKREGGYATVECIFNSYRCRVE